MLFKSTVLLIFINVILKSCYTAYIDKEELALRSPTKTKLDHRGKCNYCDLKTMNGKPNTFCEFAHAIKPQSRCTKVFTFGLKPLERRQILYYHNKLRSKVALGKETKLNGKKAGDMNELRWSNELAKGAQLWANQCKFKHDGSVTCSFDWIGQNLYTSGFQGTPSDPKGSWKDAVDSWYSEVNKFRGSTDIFKFNFATGHFSQIIWAKTTHIGCGYISHKGYNGETKFNTKFYVCNYGPGGNFNNRPIFVTGTPCSGCPNGTTCKKGLCSKTGNNNDQVDEPSIPEQCMSLWDI